MFKDVFKLATKVEQAAFSGSDSQTKVQHQSYATPKTKTISKEDKNKEKGKEIIKELPKKLDGKGALNDMAMAIFKRTV